MIKKLIFFRKTANNSSKVIKNHMIFAWLFVSVGYNKAVKMN